MKNLKKDNKGFTLVELIVVIAILGVLMAVLVPQYIQYVEKARQGTDESVFGEIAHNMEINAATSELLSGDNFTAEITLPSNVGETISYTIKYAGSATDKTNLDTAAATLTKDVQAVVPTDTKLKSKKYTIEAKASNTQYIYITMVKGKVTSSLTAWTPVVKVS